MPKIKKLLEKDAYEALSDEMKDLYSEGADKKFHLDMEDDDAAALKSAKEHEKEKRLAAEKRARDAEAAVKKAEDRLAELGDADHRKAGDIDALDASWKKKFEAAQTESDEKLKKLQDAYTKDVVESQAKALASDISTAPELLLPHIRSRFSVEFGDDGPSVKILDADGKISALTSDDLRKEVVNNTAFAPIITGSKAKGSGAPGSDGGGAPKKFAEMNPQERAKLRQENPGEYERLHAAEPKPALTI